MFHPRRLQKNSRSTLRITVSHRVLLATTVAILALVGVGVLNSSALKSSSSQPAANAGIGGQSPGRASGTNSDALRLAGRSAQPAKEAVEFTEPFRFLNPSLATITASKTDALLVDNDLDNKADPGDTLRYSVTIGVSGMDATGVVFSDTVDPNTAFVAGSLRTTPLARPDSYTATGNIRITKNAAAGVLVNDQDFDAVGPAVTVTAGTFLSANNGNVTINADGSFTYNPPPGFEGNDTFTYTLNDNDTPNQTDTGTVTVAVSGMFWFVNSAASCPCDGRLTNPFVLLTGVGSFDAVAADDPGDNIFLYSGSYTGGLTLLANQRLIGQGAGASLSSITGITPPAGSDSLPGTGGTRPTVSNAGGSNILLGSGNYLRGFDIGNSAAGGSGISGNGIGTLTVTEMLINGTGRALNLDTGTLGATFDSITSTNSTTNGIRLNNVGGVFTVSGATTITNPTQVGISISNVSNIGTPSFQFAGVTINNRNNTGILLDEVDNSGGTMSFGATTIPNPNNAGGYGIRVEDSSAPVAVASATISNANVTVAQTDGDNDGFPGTDGDGDAIFLKDNSGSFTLNGGTLSNCGNDCIDLRNSPALTLSAVNISTPGIDIPLPVATGAGFGGHGISAVNMTGTSSVNNVTISSVNVGNRDGFYVVNNTSTALTLTLQNSTFQNFTGNRGFAIEGDATANMTATVTNCTFSNISAVALQHIAGGSTGSTATVNMTVQNSTFQNSPVNGKTNLLAGVVEAGKATLTIQNNTFNNVFETASTGEAVLGIGQDGTLAGNSLSLNVSGNTINEVGSANSNCGGAGTTPCLGPLWAIIVFIDDQANVPGTLVIDNNTITNTRQGGIDLDMANSGAIASNVAAKITNNCIGRLRVAGACTGADARIGQGAGLAVGRGISVERRRIGAKTANVLVSGNTVRNGAGQSAGNLNTPSIFGRTHADTQMSITVTNNNLDNAFAAGAPEIRLDTNSPVVGDPATQIMCSDITGNTIPAGGQIDINEIVGTHNVEQASQAAVAAANPSATVMADAGVTFGVACAAPPAAHEDAIARNNGAGSRQEKTPSSVARRLAGASGGVAALATSRDSLNSRAEVRYEKSSAKLTEDQARSKRKSDDGRVFHHARVSTAATREHSTSLAPVADVMVNIGQFPAGKTITVTFDATVDNPWQGATNQVCNQGTVTADGGISVQTDDPSVGGPADATCTTIDQPDVTVAVAPSSVLEDGPTDLVYTFTREGSTAAALTVNFTVGGTASSSTDYAVTGAATFDGTNGTVTIPIGSSVASINVNPVTDSTVEADETVIVSVAAGTSYDIGTPGSANGTITNDDTDVSVAVAPSSVAEDGAPNLVYTFTRVGVTSTPLTVNFTIAGTATFNNDYTQTGAATFSPPNGTVSFGAGNSTTTVTVDPTADSTVEPDETVILTLAAGTGYNVIEPSSATGTITNDDADVSIAVAPSSVDEDGATNLVYTFTRVGFTGGSLVVNFTIGGTATFGASPNDYTQTGATAFTPPNGTVTFGAGNSTATVTVNPETDVTSEPDETVILTLAAGTGYNVVEPSSATGTILDDDVFVSVAVSPGAVDEDGTTNLVYTFTRNDSNGALTANFSIGGTATFNNDYTETGAATFVPPNGTVSFADGSLTTTVTVDPSADITVEPDETVILTVVAGTGYNVGVPASANGTITNDDTDVSVAVAPSSTSEDGAGNLVYTFTRVGVTTGALTVNFSVGGTATFNDDYTETGADTFTPPTGTVSFGAGNSTAMVTVDPTADTTVEPDETVILTVAPGTGYNVAAMNNSATGTITNDDTDVSIAVSPSSVAEDGATNLVYTFTRVGVTSSSLVVNFTIGGTATFGASPNDFTQTGATTFTPPNGTVTFGAGNSTAAITVNPETDTTSEPDETVILTLAAGTGYNVVEPSSATGTITNDDIVVSVAVSPGAVDEDGVTNLVYTFTRNDSNGTLTANFSIGGTATFNNDYTESGAATFVPPNGTVSFADGSLTATVTVDPSADITVELDETVILTVVAGAGYAVGSPSSASGTITNDDTDVSVAVAPSSTLEDGAGNLVYTFTRVGVTTGALTVNFSVGGTATFNDDYTETGADTFTPPTGTVSFGAGNSTAMVTLDPSVDTTVEPDETVILTVAPGTGYNVAAMNNSATGTITNDDTDVSIAVSPSSVAEDGATNLVYTFTRVGVTSGALTVNFTIGGTATFGASPNDYTQSGAASFVPPNGTVMFVGGNSTATITVNPETDVISEPDETVILTLAAGTGYNVATPSSATGTIANDDAADVEITAKTDTPDPVCVGQNITYTIGFRNNGSGPAANAKVSDTIPTNTTFVSATLPSGWSRADTVVAGGTGTLMFTKPAVANGETASFTVVVNINAGTTGGTLISNTATASSDFPDDVPGNNSKTATTTVDPTPPTISTVTADPASLWPPNHRMRDVTINYTATDGCPGAVNCTITNITSNEPVNGTGDGDTSPDWEFVDNHHVRLRAEHAGGSSGRIYTITVTCTDAAGNTSSKTVEVHVAHNITGPTSGASFKINTAVNFSGTFWDVPGRRHTARWEFDGLTTNGTVTEPSGSKSGIVKGSYTFKEPGVYKVKLNITDNTGVTSWVDTQNDLEAIVVIYDPAAGYTIGGGWIVSPAGAYAADPSLTGKLSFGFNSKYFKNATNPKGEAQIEFKLGEFEFNALNYDVLVISKAMAQFRGFGKINGVAGYDFTLTVIDGDLAGGGGVDKFRIKIWNKVTGAIVYDNEMGQSDAADPITPVGTASSIVIKK